MATNVIIELPLYVPPLQDPETPTVDTLNRVWKGMLAYESPPTALIGGVLNKMQGLRESGVFGEALLTAEAMISKPSK